MHENPVADLPERVSSIRQAIRDGELESIVHGIVGEFGTANIAFGSISLLAFTIGNSIELCRFVPQSGAVESNWKAHQRVPELHFAASCDDLSYAKLLLDHGHDIHTRDVDGNTPLHSAVQDGSPAMANFLYDQGADPTLKNRRNESPLNLADIYDVDGLDFRNNG